MVTAAVAVTLVYRQPTYGGRRGAYASENVLQNALLRDASKLRLTMKSSQRRRLCTILRCTPQTGIPASGPN